MTSYMRLAGVLTRAVLAAAVGVVLVSLVRQVLHEPVSFEQRWRDVPATFAERWVK